MDASSPTEKNVTASITSIAEFDAFALSSPRSLHVLFFWASWDNASAPGGAMWRLVSTLAALHSSVLFARVEAEEVFDVTEQLTVVAVPTVVFLRGGRVIERVEGARAAEVTARLEALAARGAGGDAEDSGEVPASLAALTTRLRDLTVAAPIMLFMKGSPTEPRCGFSRKMVELLRAEGAAFGSFDILSDKAVREGLREYGQWPTYPQLWAAGKLVGGLDVANELKESGELRSALGLSDLTMEESEAAAQAAAAIIAAAAGRTAALAAVASAPAVLFMKGTIEAPACGYSERAAALLTDGGVTFRSVDVLSEPVLREAVKTLGEFPTYPQLWVRGELVGGVDAIRELAAQGGGGSGSLARALSLAPAEPLLVRLARLVNAARGVLFMKGEPSAPRCGFSATTVELLAAAGAPIRGCVQADAAKVGERFAYFDILSDSAVREGIKETYKWPTYPQLYVNGALVGGLDVMREMDSEGELRTLLAEAGCSNSSSSNNHGEGEEEEEEEAHGHSHGGEKCSGTH